MLQAIKRVQKILCVWLCLLGLAPLSFGAENLNVWVVLSDSSAPYQSFAKELNNSFPASIHSTVLEHPEQLSAAVPQADLIVTVGMKAAELAATRSNIPILAAMVPQAGYEALLTQASPKPLNHAMTAIYLDQPWLRRIDFWHAALPGRHRLGLLYSPETPLDVARLRQQVTLRDGTLMARPLRSADELFARLETVLASSDVLLAIPDSQIYNSSNIRNILLTSYRHGVPLIGLSQAYVNAGALCAIFSTPEQLAIQASRMVIAFARNKELPKAQYPEDFTIAVNQQVARSLAIEMRSPEAIRSQMDKAKEERR
jgi:putative ABC transport system substrate-binding protein